MAKKMKKQIVIAPTHDPNLEEVTEDRAMEIEYDEETNEAVIVHHYRRQWGDGFDADVEHGFSIEENSDLIGTLMSILNAQKQHALVLVATETALTEKSTLSPIEKLPGETKLEAKEEKKDDKIKT